MKLYREATPLEINSNKAFYGGAIGFGFFVPVEIIEKEIDKHIDETIDVYPYKQSGDRDSYSEYNEGWTDGCDVLGDRIKRWLLSKLKGDGI